MLHLPGRPRPTFLPKIGRLVPNVNRRRNLSGSKTGLIAARIAVESSAVKAGGIIATPPPKRFFVHIIEAHPAIYTASAAAHLRTNQLNPIAIRFRHIVCQALRGEYALKYWRAIPYQLPCEPP